MFLFEHQHARETIDKRNSLLARMFPQACNMMRSLLTTPWSYDATGRLTAQISKHERIKYPTIQKVVLVA